jgi:RNA polymerase sigma-70 factor (ECF subfamily)
MNTIAVVTQQITAVHRSLADNVATAEAASTEVADAFAIKAIRGGDRERYRELMERHSSKVFAVAWSRLGDRHLAEEAAQEAFIKGYQRLALLDHAERFGSWITAIARNAAINLGLKRRAEVRKREQWLLEKGADLEPNTTAAPLAGEKPLGETLRETLAALPAVHRECLVLFYIERKSVAEAAQALGLTETAFKTRLHRARGVLRDRMEAQLEKDLGSLRPSAALVSAVMLALPAGKPVWSLGAAAAGLAAKLSPAAALGFLLQLVQVGPAVAVQYWIGKKEIENLRDREGLRARNIIRTRNTMILSFIVIIVMIAFTKASFDIGRYFQIFGVLFLLLIVPGLRQLRLSRHRAVVANWAGTTFLAVGFLGLGFLEWHFTMLFVFQGCFFLFMSIMVAGEPIRTDLSPFIAAQSGTIPCPIGTLSEGNDSPVRSAGSATTGELFAFSRFLGDRLRAMDWRRGPDWIRLRLAPVTASPALGCFPTIWGDASTLTLHTSGRVEAHLGERDSLALEALAGKAITTRERLEDQVAAAAIAALQAFRAGNTADAEAQFGIESDSTLYRVEPNKTTLSHTRRWILRAVGVLMIATGIVGYVLDRWDARHAADLPARTTPEVQSGR